MTKFPDNSLTWVIWPKFPDFFSKILTFPWPGEKIFFPWHFPDMWQPWYWLKYLDFNGLVEQTKLQLVNDYDHKHFVQLSTSHDTFNGYGGMESSVITFELRLWHTHGFHHECCLRLYFFITSLHCTEQDWKTVVLNKNCLWFLDVSSQTYKQKRKRTDTMKWNSCVIYLWVFLLVWAKKINSTRMLISIVSHLFKWY